MPLKSLFNGSKKRKVPAGKKLKTPVPSTRSELCGFWPHKDVGAQELYGRQLVEWAKQDTSLEIDDFFNEKQIGPKKFYDACKSNAFLAECRQIARSFIGARMRKKVEFDSQYIYKLLPQYMSVFIDEREEKLEANNNTVINTIYHEEKIGMPVFGDQEHEK